MANMIRAGYIPPDKPEKPERPPKKTKRKTPKRRKRRGGWNAVGAASVVIFLMAMLLCAGIVYVYLQTAPYANAFLPGTMLGGYPLGGAEYSRAEEILRQQTEERIDAWTFTVTCMDYSRTLTAEDMGLQADTEATLGPLWAAGRDGGMAERFMQMLKLRDEPLIMQPQIRCDLTAVEELTRELEQQIEREAADAEVRFTPGSSTPLRYTEETIGFSVNTDDVAKQVEAAALALEPGVLELTAEPILPEVTMEALLEASVLRSRCVMKLESNREARQNAARAAQMLNGVRIDAGEQLSFNEIVGARTEEAGYVPAPESAYGSDEAGLGGGVCQTASALYQAAVCGGLTIVQRSAAVRPMPCCEPGQEAAVSDQGLDLVIGNDTGGPVFLMTRIYEQGEEMILELCLIGRKQDGWAVLVTEQTEQAADTEPVYVRDREGRYAVYTDERVPVGEALAGVTARVSCVYTDRTGEEIARYAVSTDVYEPVRPVVYVGIQERETP